jgi:lysophospholipase L1-like esterase
MPERTAIRLVWLVAVTLSLTALPAAAASRKTQHSPPFSWEPVSRFGGDANGDGIIDHASDPTLPRVLTAHPVRIWPAAPLCARNDRLVWRVDHAVVPDVRVRGSGARCNTVLTLPAGTHTVSINGHAERVRVDDRLVVAIGDSVGAGEGDPPFVEQRCHRSHRAGFEEAARRIAAAQHRTSITFVSLACSGAQITAGLLDRYDGTERHAGQPTLAPQVERLRALWGQNHHRVDAVLVSIGANDVYFGAIVRFCIAIPSCFKQRFMGRETTNTKVGFALEGLIDRYQSLAKALKGTAHTPSDVVISEYHDPTHGADGQYCSHTGVQLSQEELEWAHDSLLVPLNERVAAAARRYGWRHVGGIARDFATHGYCSPDRWVRTLPAQLQRKGATHLVARALGTLHPSVHGQMAIANHVAPVLARALALPEPPAVTVPPAHNRLTGIPKAASTVGKLVLAWLILGLLAALGRGLGAIRWVLVVLGGLITFAWHFIPRLFLLLLPRHVGDVVALPLEYEPAPASLEPTRGLTAAAALLFVLGVALVVPIGIGILWVRFRLAQIPADDALGAVSFHELLATGAPALLVVTGVGALAVLTAWAADHEGTSQRASRRLLGALLTGALVAVVASQHYPGDDAVQLVAGFVIGAWLVHVIVDLVLQFVVVERGPAAAIRKVASDLRLGEGGVGRVVWRFLPVTLIVGDVVWAWHVDSGTRPLLVVPLIAAALCFVTLYGIGQAAESPSAAVLDVPRLLLAAGALGVLLSLLYRDERWLAAVTAIALLLAAACLRVATVSRRRFAPYAMALFVAVGAFMAAEGVLAAAREPQVQPFAAITTDGRGVCGAYVGHSDGRLWYAQVQLDERGDHRTPASRSGRLRSVRDELVSVNEIGSLQSVAHALGRAADVRDALARERRITLTLDDRAPQCRPASAPAPAPAQGDDRDLALEYQPDLVLDARDGFWPIPVSTIFAMQDRRAHACRVIPDARPPECLRLDRPSDLPWQGGEGQSIEYPAAMHISNQHREMIDALGTANPDRTATIYYLVTHREGRRTPWAIQYWFYYAYDYLRVAKGTLGNAGKHEGDWEHIGVMLSADKHPRFLWTARHTAREEGRVYAWRDTRVQWRGDHPVIYIARGSHASYVHCGVQPRYQLPHGLISDTVSCDPRHQLRLPAAATALHDLSRAPWACWAGNFGHAPRGVLEQLPYNVLPGPRSPLWQQQFDAADAEPCSELAAPTGSRDGPGEEVVRGHDVHVLRSQSGKLHAVADHCSDWDKAPGDGSYLVVCSGAMMRRQRASGFAAKPPGVRVDVYDGNRGLEAAPAVAGDERLTSLDRWLIHTRASVHGLSIYAACRRGGGVLRARFDGVSLAPGGLLLVDTHGKGQWLLRDAEDRVVQSRAPVVAEGHTGHGTSCRG